MDRQIEVLARFSGLAQDWQQSYGDVGMSIKQTNANDSDVSVADTVALMGVHVNQAKTSPQVLAALRQAGVRAGETEDSVIAKVFRYIKSKVRFTEDESQLADLFQTPNSKELLITPPVLLTMARPQGDCDDFSMLCCSMLRAMGIRCDFVTVAADSKYPTQFTHIYCLATKSNGEQVPLDTSHGKQVGWETPNQTRKMVWPVMDWGEGDSMNQSMLDSALGRLGDLWDEGTGSYTTDSGVPIGYGGDFGLPDMTPTYVPTPVPVNSGPNPFTAILPGVFGAFEKVIVQTTQKPGIQTVGPNGQYTSQVLADGQTNSALINVPGTSLGASGNLLIYGLIGLAAAFVISKAVK